MPDPTPNAPTAPAALARGTADEHDSQLSGLDALQLSLPPEPGRLTQAWAGLWPKLLAAALFLAGWQLWATLRGEPWILPGPAQVLPRFFDDLGSGRLLEASANTMSRAVIGFALAVAVGLVVGLGVARNRTLRAAFGSMITGLQTMPTIAWFPLAILLFGLSETAIKFVVVLGAAPAVANGIIAGLDHTPPLLLRAGKVLGARGLAAYRHIILPAALPGFVAGLKQGWAFSWRSLMAGELLVIIANKPSLGVSLQLAREFSDATGMLSAMLTIFAIGVVVDAALFGRLDRAVRRRWGLGAA